MLSRMKVRMVGCCIVLTSSLVLSQDPLKSLGTPFVSTTAPYGTGAKSIEVIRDGIYPDPLTGSWGDAYDTYDGTGAIEAFYGYTFDVSYSFSKLVFVQGVNEVENGSTYGTFDGAPRVQVLIDTTWTDVQGLQSSTPYSTAFPAFTPDTFSFTPTVGKGIRIIGMEQANEPWVSCAELDVFGLPEGTASQMRLRAAGAAPLSMTISGNRLTVAHSSTMDVARLVISDLTGRVVHTHDVGIRGTYTLSREELSGGMYVARLLSGNTVVASSALVW